MAVSYIKRLGVSCFLGEAHRSSKQNMHLVCPKGWQLEKLSASFLLQKELHDRYISFHPYT